MKLSSLIETIKREKPHSFSPEDVTKFVNEVEAVIQEYLEAESTEWKIYDWENDGGKELIVSAPYNRLYESFVKAKIDFANEEYESYATNQAQYNADLEEWKAYVMRSGLVRTEAPRIRNWW